MQNMGLLMEYEDIDSETLQKYMEACEKKRKESLPD